MAEYRTTIQIEANRLDMELHRAMQHVERFAAEWLSGDVGSSLHDKAGRINAIRNEVRHHMHREDRDASANS